MNIFQPNDKFGDRTSKKVDLSKIKLIEIKRLLQSWLDVEIRKKREHRKTPYCN